MTLRTRFTVAVACAVATVALAITAVAFLVLRADLQNQVKGELQQQAAVVHRLARHYHGQIPAGWVPPERFGASAAYAQVVTAQGTVWAPDGDSGLLPAPAAAAEVAAGQRASYYNETTLNGVHAMVLTTPLAPGLAVQLAVPLNAVDQELGTIGATLALLSAAGVGLAALAGGGWPGPASSRWAAWPRWPSRSPRPGIPAAGSRWTGGTSSAGWPHRSTPCWAPCSGRWPPSGSWSATPATSCARP